MNNRKKRAEKILNKYAFFIHERRNNIFEKSIMWGELHNELQENMCEDGIYKTILEDKIELNLNGNNPTNSRQWLIINDQWIPVG